MTSLRTSIYQSLLSLREVVYSEQDITCAGFAIADESHCEGLDGLNNEGACYLYRRSRWVS